MVALTVAACSRTELVYENADWFGAWRIADYLELSSEQRGRLRDGLAAYQGFHRENRLPAINDYLERVDTLLARPAPQKAEVRALFADGEDLIKTNIRDLIPLTAELLMELNTEQISALETTLAEGREAYLERLATDREARAMDRTQDWIGPLQPEQRQTLTQCVADMPNVTEPWQEWRQQTEQELISLLRNEAPQTDVEALLEGWLLEDAARSPALQAYRQTARTLWQQCTHAMLTTLTPEQRQHARQRLKGYRGDLETVAAR